MAAGMEYLPTGFQPMDNTSLYPGGAKRARQFKQKGYFKAVTKKNSSGYAQEPERAKLDKKQKKTKHTEEVRQYKEDRDLEASRAKRDLALERARKDEQILTHLRASQKSQYAAKNLPDAIRRQEQSRLSMIQKLSNRSNEYRKHENVAYGHALDASEHREDAEESREVHQGLEREHGRNYVFRRARDMDERIEHLMSKRDNGTITRHEQYELSQKFDQMTYAMQDDRQGEAAVAAVEANNYARDEAIHRKDMNADLLRMGGAAKLARRTEGMQYASQLDHMEQQMLAEAGYRPPQQDVGYNEELSSAVNQMMSDYPAAKQDSTSGLQQFMGPAGSGLPEVQGNSVFQRANHNMYRGQIPGSHNTGDVNPDTMYSQMYDHPDSRFNQWLNSTTYPSNDLRHGSVASFVRRQQEKHQRQQQQQRQQQEDESDDIMEGSVYGAEENKEPEESEEKHDDDDLDDY